MRRARVGLKVMEGRSVVLQVSVEEEVAVVSTVMAEPSLEPEKIILLLFILPEEVLI